MLKSNLILSLLTTSHEEMSNGMNCSAAVGAQLDVSDEEATNSSPISDKRELEPLVPVMVDKGLNEMPSRTVPLSKRERLVLRKQALKMKKASCACRRNNTVTGVAKSINAHFQKHPLAIVNVKGRAKGTSV